MRTCKLCGTDIGLYFLGTGNPVLLDREPHPTGEYATVGERAVNVKMESDWMQAAYGGPLYQSHRVTCGGAKK